MAILDFLKGIFKKPNVVADTIGQETEVNPTQYMSVATGADFNKNPFSGLQFQSPVIPMTPIPQSDLSIGAPIITTPEPQEGFLSKAFNAIFNQQSIEKRQIGNENFVKNISYIFNDAKNFYKSIVLNRNIESNKLQTALAIFDANIVSSEQKGTKNAKLLIGADRFDSWVNTTDDLSVDSFKTYLKDSNLPQRWINGITDETIDKGISLIAKGQIEFGPQETERQNLSIETSLAKTIGTSYEGGVVIKSEDAIKIATAMEGLDITKTDINSFKNELAVKGVSRDIINSINKDNIVTISDNYSMWKLNNGVIGFDKDGGYEISDGGYDTKFDKDGNVVDQKQVAESYTIIDKKLIPYGMNEPDRIKVQSLLLQLVQEANPGVTGTEIGAVTADATKSFLTEVETQKRHLAGTVELIRRAERDGETELAITLERGLREDIKIYNNFSRNILELTAIKVANKLVGKDLKNYIEKNYGLNINDYLKRDENGKQMYSKYRSVADYLIDRQIKTNYTYYMNSKYVDESVRAYHAVIDPMDRFFGSIKTGISPIIQSGTVRAQIENIGAFDPVPGRQAGELWRRTITKGRGLADETLAFLAPDIIMAVASGGLSIPGSTSKGLIKAGVSTDKIAGLLKVADGANTLNKFVKGTFATTKGGGVVNTFGLSRSMATNASLRALREFNIESQANRIDPERGNEWNTNFALGTLLVPWIFDFVPAAKALGMSTDGISIFDVLKQTLGDAGETSYKELSSLRKGAAKIFSEWSDAWKSLDDQGKKQMKQNIAAGMIAKKGADFDINILKDMAIGKATQNNGMLMLNDAELFAQYVGKGMQNLGEPEMVKLIDDLKIIVLDPKGTPADIIQRVYNIPGVVTIGDISSGLLRLDPQAAKVFNDTMRAGYRSGAVDPMIQYVGSNVGTIKEDFSLMVQSIFGGKFLPSKVFSNSEMLKASEKSKGTILESVFKNGNGVYDPIGSGNWVKVEDAKDSYRLSQDGLARFGINTQPNKLEIINKVADDDREGVGKLLSSYIGRDAKALVAPDGIIRKAIEILSSKLC